MATIRKNTVKAKPARRVAVRALDLRKLIPGAELGGGIFAGLIYPKGVAQALIVGPEYDGTLTWGTAGDWARGLKLHGFTDYTLPTRKEQSLLFANAGDLFKPTWYWSSEQHASDSGSAWSQGFGTGNQHDWRKGSTLRARAVRRLAI